MTEFILIDGSYYTFYRYFAILQWYKHRKAIEQLQTPDGKSEFENKFCDLFIKKMGEIIKKLKLNDPIIIVALDCSRKNIWRKTIYPEYKNHRQNALKQDIIDIDVFKIMREKELFKLAGAHMLLHHPELEADDCLALTIRNIRNVNPEIKVTIITSDLDYLQLADENTRLINLKYQNLVDSKNCFKNKEKDLFCKIVMGDKSDGIPGIFKKCGIKTAAKYYDKTHLFEKQLKKENANDKYIKNRKLIDFNMIPQKYVDELNSGNYTTLYVDL